MNWNRLRKIILWLHDAINRLRIPMYVAMAAGLIFYIMSQNPRLEDTRLGAFLVEAGVVSLFGLGWWVARRTGRRWKLSVLFWLYLYGLFFEILTEAYWDYRWIAFVIREDISITFPLGWTGLCMIVTSASEYVYKKVRKVSTVDLKDPLLPRLDALIWILVGDSAEILFHQIGMIDRYVKIFPLGLSPFGPPWVVLLGYAILPGFLICLLIRNLEKGSLGRAFRN